MLQKKKAAEILEKQFGHNIKLSEYQIHNTVRRDRGGLDANIGHLSNSMMCLGLNSNEDMFNFKQDYNSNRYDSTFKERLDLKMSHDMSKEPASFIPQYSGKRLNKKSPNLRGYEDSNSSKVRIEEDSVHYPVKYKPERPSLDLLTKPPLLQNPLISAENDRKVVNRDYNSMAHRHLEDLENQNEYENEESEEDQMEMHIENLKESHQKLADGHPYFGSSKGQYYDNEHEQIDQEDDGYISVDTQQKDMKTEERKDSKSFKNIEYYSDEAESPNKFRIISEMESEPGFLEYNISNLTQKGLLSDKLPIRAGCFNGEYMAIGTNSK